MIWIDDDACPTAVREVVFKASDRLRFPVTLVSNHHRKLPGRTWIKAVIVGQGFDVADDYIAERVQPGDLVITQDVPLAKEVIDKGATAISVRGELWTLSNIGERLSLRDFFTEARESGMIQGGGPPPFAARDKQRFANSFDRWLTKNHKG